MSWRVVLMSGALILGSGLAANAQVASGGSKADAERAVQNYLALWSSNGNFNATVVDRFYAPRVVYYGKSFARSQVLADKRAYANAWPVRKYREVPGTFTAQCNGDRSVCKVRILMAYRRVSRNDAVSSGTARMLFEFVPADGRRKIARESAVFLR